MTVFIEKIEPPPPPLVPLTAEEQLKLQFEVASDDLWVKNLIDGLAGVIRDLKR
jgi:hypothetical protein